MLNKTIKTLLSLSLSVGVIGGNIAQVSAKDLTTTGIKTEYQMQELDRKQASTDFGNNLVQNGDFSEEGNHWKFKNCAYSDYVHNGENQGYNNSLGYVELPINQNDAVAYQNLTLKENTNYVLKAKVRVAVAGAEVTLAVKKNDLANTVSSKTIVGIDDNWQYQDVELAFNSGSNTKVQIAVMKWSAQTSGPTFKAQVLVDNVELYERDTVGGMLADGEFNNASNWDKKSAEVDGTQGVLNANSGDSHLGQKVTLVANTEYILRARVKIENADASVFLAVKNQNFENLKPAIEKQVSATQATANQWQDVEFRFNSQNNTNVKIGLLKWLEDSQQNASNPTYVSKMYIDSISLQQVSSTPVPQDDYEVIWADEFDGKGTSIDKNGLDLSKWGYELGCIRGVEQQHYTKDRENVRTEDGKLVLEVTNRDKDEQYQNPRTGANGKRRNVIYNSGSVRTHGKQEFLFGRVEVLAKLPQGQATFPAFWTLGSDFTLDGAINGAQGDGWPLSGEIDIMESIGNPNTVFQTLHYSDTSKPNYKPGADNGSSAGNGNTAAITTPGRVINGETYHVFGINWSSGKIEWYIDDQIVRTVDYSQDEAAKKALDRPQYIQLNFATGGEWPGDAGDNLAGQKFKIEYAYYAQNAQQKQQAKEYYDNTVSIQASDVTMVEGTTPDLLKDVSLTGTHKDGFTLDYSIDDEYLFTTNKDLTDTHPSNDQNQTKVVCRVGSKTQTEKLKALEPGEYNLHITAMHDSKVNVRKTVKLTITPKVELADYTKVDEAIARANALNKNHYVDFSKVDEAINAVVRGLDSTKQEQVTGYAKAIETAIDALVLKKADYSKVDTAIERTKGLIKDHYVDFTKVEIAINAVIRGKDITEQETVNRYADAINDAIEKLVLKKADYSKVDAAIERANGLVKEHYVDFTKVELAIKNVVRNLDITKQKQVDTYAKNIEDAISKLELKDVEIENIVDKSNLEKMIEKASQFKSNDYTKDSYQSLIIALSNARKVFEDKNANQAQVDAMAKTLQLAINNLKKVDNTGKPETGDDANLVNVILALGLSSLGAVLVLHRKKREE